MRLSLSSAFRYLVDGRAVLMFKSPFLCGSNCCILLLVTVAAVPDVETELLRRCVRVGNNLVRMGFGSVCGFRPPRVFGMRPPGLLDPAHQRCWAPYGGDRLHGGFRAVGGMLQANLGRPEAWGHRRGGEEGTINQN